MRRIAIHSNNAANKSQTFHKFRYELDFLLPTHNIFNICEKSYIICRPRFHQIFLVQSKHIYGTALRRAARSDRVCRYAFVFVHKLSIYWTSTLYFVHAENSIGFWENLKLWWNVCGVVYFDVFCVKTDFIRNGFDYVFLPIWIE